MSSKNGLIILSLFLIIGLLASCLGSNEYDEVPYTEDAEILSFSLSNDSISTLGDVVFSIDQNRNLIYNHDSMAYLTEIKYKAIVTYTTASGNSLLNITDGDSTWVSSGDSLEVTKPVLLKSFSIYGTTTKIYTFNLNIHQIDPDSAQYIQIASDQHFLQSDEIQTILFKNVFYTFVKTGDGIELYRSSDAVDWEKISLAELPANTIIRGIRSNGEKLFACTAAGDYYESTQADSWTKIPLDYPAVSILGYLKLGESQPQLKEGLSLTVRKDNQTVFACLSDENQWTFGDTVPAGFPVSEFASFNRERLKKGYLTVIGGISSSGEDLNNVWSTSDGYYWAKLTNTDYVFPPLRGANTICYNDEYWVFNGRQTDGVDSSKVYSSKDEGTTWTLRPEKCWPLEGYTKRSGATAVVDAEGVYFYILGGRSESGEFLPEIWKGYLNKRTFDE